MLHRLSDAMASRWRTLTHQKDRGDSPVPTVIMWIGIAVVAVGLIVWVGTYVTGYANRAPSAPAAPPTISSTP